jgi:hypothetical protein
MSKRNGKKKAKVAILNEINYTDKRMKKFKNNEEELSKLKSKRDQLTSKLKTKK